MSHEQAFHVTEMLWLGSIVVSVIGIGCIGLALLLAWSSPDQESDHV